MITVTLEGHQKLALKFSEAKDATNERDILDQAAAMILARIRQRFLTQTAPDGTKWITSQAAIDRANSGEDGGTLFASGRLFHSIEEHTEGPDARAISTDVPYDRFHQYGTIHLPKREFLGFSDEDVQLVEAMIDKRIKDAVK